VWIYVKQKHFDMLEFQKKLTKPFYALLSLPATAMGFALAVQIAALSILLKEKYGLNISDIGLVWATGPFAGIVGQVLIGIISDNVWVWNGRRRAFIWIGGLLAALMLLALPQLGIIQASLGIDGILGVAIVVSLTLDLAINVSFNPTRSIIADVTPEGRPRTKGYTWMQTVSGTFGVLNYAIGAIFGIYALIYFGAVLVFVFSMIPPFFIKEPKVLGQYGADEKAGDSADENATPDQSRASFKEIMWAILPLWGFLVYAVYGFMVRFQIAPRLPYYALEIFTFSATIILMIYTLSRKEAGKSREEGGLIGFQKVLAAHAFTWIGVQTMFIYYFAFIEQRMPELSLGEGFIERVLNWSFFSLNLVAAIIPVILLEPLAARYGRVKVHTFSIAIMAVGYTAIFYLGYSPWMLYWLMAVVGIGWAATISLPFAIMSQKIPQTKMGLYMGLFNLSVVLPQFVASLGVGEWVQEANDKSIIFVICAATVALSAIAWALVKEPADIFTENPLLREN
jgi:maltose/moltooligosaccharide transporter